MDRDQDGEQEGEPPDVSDSHRSFALWDGMSMVALCSGG